MAKLIFDYDGTLHDSMKIYGPAFRKAYSYLVSEGIRTGRDFSDQEISRWLGYTSKEMWETFAPDLSPERRDLCSQMVGNEMYSLIAEGKAQLYDGAKELLIKLKASGHTLIFLSNCRIAYMENHKNQFALDEFFDGFYCTEAFNWAPKEEIFNFIEKDFSDKAEHGNYNEFIAIGDRFHDINLASCHGLKSIGCAYGFGAPEELETSTYIANSVGEIFDLICKIEK